MQFNALKIYQKIIGLMLEYCSQLEGWKITGVVVVFKKESSYKSIAQDIEKNKTFWVDGGLEFFVNEDRKNAKD